MAGFTQLCGIYVLVFEMCWVCSLLCSILSFRDLHMIGRCMFMAKGDH